MTSDDFARLAAEGLAAVRNEFGNRRAVIVVQERDGDGDTYRVGVNLRGSNEYVAVLAWALVQELAEFDERTGTNIAAPLLQQLAPFALACDGRDPGEWARRIMDKLS